MAERSPVPSGRVSPRFVSEDRRNHAFRSLVSDIAERLSDSDIQNIIWQQDVPSSLQNKVSALEVLEYLYKNGVYTEHEVRPLAQLLKDIHREDLTSRVDTFWKQFGRHFSNIDDSKRRHAARQFSEGRRSTLSSSKPLTVVMAPNRAIPTIVTTTEADQESQGSSAVVLPDNDKFFSTTSSPSSLSVSSIPSIPELQPVNNHPSQKERLRATTSPLQHCYYPHSSNIIHSKSEGVLHTGSPLSLHRPAVNHRFSEPSSSSYSRLEIPLQGLSPQTHISFPNAGPSYSENATYHNTSLPNGDCMTIPSHRPMSRSVSLEYHHQPHRCGQGHQIYRSPSPLIYSHGNHSCSPSNHVIVLEVAQNSHSKTDFPPPTVPCNCIENQCPHCGSVRGFSMLHHQPATVHVPVVTYTTHEGQISMLTMSSSPSTRRTKRGPNASKERGANWKLNTNQLSSAVAFQREQFMNPDESDSESEHCSRTYDDQEPNEATVCAENESSHNKLANNGSMRPMESSDCKSENKKVTEQRPLSATIGAASDAVTTTSTKYNLHASTDTLGNAECTNSRDMYTSSCMPTLGAKPNWKHVLFPDKKKVLHSEPNRVIWPVKRDKLNKYIYKHTSKLKTCKAKLQLVPDQDNYGPLPKFILQLHPYGSEEDSNKCITAKVTIDFPKKCRLLSRTKIEFQISARKDDPSTGREIGHKKTQQVQVTQSFFYIKEFISHEELKNSHCNHIYVIAAVKLI